MIIYGTRATKIHSEEVSGLKCDYCNEKRRHIFSFFSKYVHIFWIPLFPISKKGMSECVHCKSTNDKKHMNEELKFAYENVKLNAKRPIWHWIGLIIIVFVIFVLPSILRMSR